MRVQRITADTQVATDKIIIRGMALFPDGSNAASVVIYNEADSSKTAAQKVWGMRCTATESREITFSQPLLLSAGCYIDITGTNAELFLLIG